MRARATHRSGGERSGATRPTPSAGTGRERAGHRPDPRAAVPRYLENAALRGAPAVVVQRQEAEGTSSGPSFRLPQPSLLRPPDPYALYRPDFGFRYRFDDDLAPWALARGRTLLSPTSVLAGVAPLVPVVHVPAPTGGASPPSAPSTPTAPSTTPQTPSPDAATSTPRPGSGGDVASAVLAMPQVARLLEDIQGQFTSGFSRYWENASLGEQIGFVSSSVVVGGALLAPVLGFEEPRDFVLPLLNDLVIPVPGLSGYGLELRFGERDVMVGAHLDVGLLMPSIWGFGPASFQAIGGPPGSDPNALPPLSRKAEGPLAGADGPSVAAGLRATSGRGGALQDGTRARMEPALGTDLGEVRVHTDRHADAMARALRAQAFTSGRDIFFREGRYAPSTPEGGRLLAHELAHVAQQARGPVAGVPLGGGLSVGEAGGAHEREADTLAERAVRRGGSNPAPAAYAAPAARRAGSAGGSVQLKPDRAAATGPVSPEQARRMAPPPFTDYFDEVVPAVLEAADSDPKVGIERALWLLIQAYGEQSPVVTGRPSKHHNRLFNEHADVVREGKKITGVVPGQESEGISIYDLPQNESPTRDKTDIKSSPTFGYDTPERSAHHHLKQLQRRWKPAWTALTNKPGSFDQFADALQAAGYARSKTYAADLKALQGQVRRDVKAWIKYRLPEMRAHVAEMEAYLAMLREQREVARQALAEQPGREGRLAAELDTYDDMVRGAELELEGVRERLDRLERFSTQLSPAASPPAPIPPK